MSTADEARAEAERRYPMMSPHHDAQAFRREGFVSGADWQASRPITDEQVEAAAAAISKRSTWPSLHWPDIRGAQHRDVAVAFARAALEAASGVQS